MISTHSQRRTNLLTTILVTAACLGLAATRSYSWLGDPRATVATDIDNAAIALLTVPIIAAFESAQSVRRKTRSLELTTVRGRPRLVRRSIEIAIYGLFGIFLSLAVTLILGIVVANTYSVGPPVWWILPTLAYAIVLAAIGGLLGPIIQWPPLSIALGPLGWVILGLLLSNDASSGLITVQARASAERPFTAQFILKQFGFLAALALILLSVLRRKYNPWVMATSLVVCLTSAASLATTPASNRTAADPSVLVPVCANITTTTQFCAANSEESISNLMSTWATEALDYAQPFSTTTTRVVTERASLSLTSGASSGDPGTVVIYPRHGFDVAVRPSRQETVAGAVEGIINPGQCRMQNEQGETTMGQILRWYLVTNHLEVVPTEPAAPVYDYLQSAPIAARTKWLAQHRAAIQACGDLTP